MTEQITPSPKRRRLPFSSLSAKIVLILLAMGAVSALLGIVASVVFTRLNDSMAALTTSKLQTLQQSSALIAAADGAKNAMVGVLVAGDSAALAEETDTLASASETLTHAVAALPEEIRGTVQDNATNATATLERLANARRVQFRNEAGIADQLAQLQTRSATLQARMTELADDVVFELSLSGAETLDAVDATLADLVESQFLTLQELLQARAEINLLTGSLFSLQLTNDSATRSILLDISTGSFERLTGTLGTLEGIEHAADYVGTIAGAHARFEGFIADSRASGGFAQNGLKDEILAARRDIDVDLSGAIDDISFMLIIAAEEAGSENRDSIQNLLDNEVTKINTLFEITSWISKFQESALNMVIAPGSDEAKAASAPLGYAAEALVGFADFADSRLADDLKAFAALADAEIGLLPYKLSVLKADATAKEATEATSVAVLEISRLAAELGMQSQSQIATMAADIQAEIATANTRIMQLLYVLGGGVVLALILTRLLVQRPLRRLLQATERLAEGDLQEITGFARSSQEIYRIAHALSGFRDGLLEKKEMTARQEAEHQARMAEQTSAVSAIGQGLERLSRGDLTQRIDLDMAEGYVKLRDDFNRAQDDLRTLLGEMTQASSRICEGADEINTAADDLSRRTESQAASLEESVAALDQVTAQVNVAAENARDVEGSLNTARGDAENTGEVVRSAIDAMQEIKGSSDKISSIVGVIDDIAFQTNLLALNAGVEAARAGSAGSGFAVVAAEVRGLAQKSSESAREIKRLIDESTSQVDQGVNMVGRAGDALITILDHFRDVTSKMANIAASANEQAGSLKEVNVAMTHLDRVTQDNAAMVQQATTATSRLNDDASTLVSLAAKFSTGETTVTAPPRAEPEDLSDWGSAA